MANPPFIILSYDGGGMRGVITANCCRAWIRHSCRAFRCSRHIDGSIIALGLAAAADRRIVSLYEYRSNCNEIFTPYEPGSVPRSASHIAAAIPPQIRGCRRGNRLVEDPATGGQPRSKWPSRNMKT